jgi:hypothetical protein
MMRLATEGPKQLPKLPIVKHADTSPIMVPMWTIGGYVDRPACLPENAAPPESKSKGNGEVVVSRGGGPAWDTPASGGDVFGSDDIPFAAPTQ